MAGARIRIAVHPFLIALVAAPPTSAQASPSNQHEEAVGCYSIAGASVRTGESVEIEFRLTSVERRSRSGTRFFDVQPETPGPGEGIGYWTLHPASKVFVFWHFTVPAASISLSFPKIEAGLGTEGELRYFGSEIAWDERIMRVTVARIEC
jgi:hypothetical protein